MFGLDTKTLIEIIVLGSLGIFAILGIFDRTARQRRKDGDEVEDRVITLLKEEVAALTKKVEEGVAWRRDAEIRMERVITENKTLRDILQGKDNSTKEYQKMGIEAMKRGERVEREMQAMNKNIERLAVSIEKVVSGGVIKTTHVTEEVKTNG